MTTLARFREVVRRDRNSLAVVTTVTAVVIWFTGVTPDPTTRMVSSVLAGFLAFFAGAVGLTVFGE
jgi:hypothetical protein